MYADSNGPRGSGAQSLGWTTAAATHWSANYFSIPPTVSNPGTTYTTDYSYDQNGNLTGTQIGATSTTYTYDYANRLITSAGTGKTTTNYTYDQAGNRLTQYTSTTTTIYPSRYYSITQTIVGTTTYATSTEYVYAGDTLIATIDQRIVNGAATGTPTVRYVHVDHLGSTQVTSDTSGNLVQFTTYSPYGAVLAQQGSGLKRGYIGQFFDDSSSLNYLNARYYDSARGQFVSQDPVFWNVKQNLANPQSLNSYSYAEGNPVTKKDPSGLLTKAQNDQLNSIKAQLEGILAALQSGNVSQNQLGAMQQTVSAASAAVSRIAVGGNATLAPAYVWAPPTTPGYIAPYMPNITNGVLPIPGGNTRDSAFSAIGFMLMATPVPGDELIFGGGAAAKFFEGTRYSEKVIGQMEWEAQALFKSPGRHAFPELVRNFARDGEVIKGTGDAFRTLNIRGSYNGADGIFQFMKNSEGLINHRLFIPY